MEISFRRQRIMQHGLKYSKLVNRHGAIITMMQDQSKKMKTTYGWTKTKLGADVSIGTNESGFAALPTGDRDVDGKFDNHEESGMQLATWWSSSLRDHGLTFSVVSAAGKFEGNQTEGNEGEGYYIRCVKN